MNVKREQQQRHAPAGVGAASGGPAVSDDEELTPDEEERDALADEISAHMDGGCADCERANAAVGAGADPHVVVEMRCLYGSTLQRRAAFAWGGEEL